jgi:hypothetical protein
MSVFIIFMKNEYNKPFSARTGFQKIVDTVSESYHKTPLTINKESTAFEHAVKLIFLPINIAIVCVKAIIDQANWKK